LLKFLQFIHIFSIQVADLLACKIKMITYETVAVEKHWGEGEGEVSSWLRALAAVGKHEPVIEPGHSYSLY
jgi:hypothetical protein